ncbi:MAG: flagellar motor protein MotB [bacterium]
MAEGSRRRRAPVGHGGHGGGHHGGAWKVAYADFTTAMMAFFLLLWILSSSSPQQKQAIANYFRDEGPFRNGGATRGGGSAGKAGAGLMPGSGDKLIEMEINKLNRAAEEIQKEISGLGVDDAAKQVQVSMSEDGLVIEIADDENDAIFTVGGTEMDPKFQAIFDAVAENLSAMPNRVRIEGYTDARQYPADAAYTNWELSADRANAARRRLEAHGLERNRFESIVGNGDGYPAVADNPLAPANRRITITVLKQAPEDLDVSEWPDGLLGADGASGATNAPQGLETAPAALAIPAANPPH